MAPMDFKKTLKALYVPSSKKPAMVEVPKMNYLMIDGHGDPNTSVAFQEAVTALYGFSYTIRMLPKKGIVPQGYFEYVVPPLEGIWNTVDHADFDPSRKDKLKWTLMIMQPSFVDAKLVEQVREKVKAKVGNLADHVHFVAFKEGLCAHILHIGPYDLEPATKVLLEEFATAQGYQLVKSGHHEIYLNDFRRTAPEKLKTVLRYPLKPLD